jgi:hypothetical protein
MPAWFLYLLLGIGLQVVGYMLMPKPKQPKPPEATDMDAPTATAGRPVAVIFGELHITGPNILWWGQKYLVERDIEIEGGK